MERHKLITCLDAETLNNTKECEHSYSERITSSITTKTLRSLDRKIIQVRIELKEKGSTPKETLSINTYEQLAEV